jgi:2Fe-2S ferredoxin
MATITYIDAGTNATIVDVPSGWSLMQGAVTNGIEGIVGECGGACACGTCHCYVDEAWLAALGAPHSDELDMLETVAAERRANSRLACQLCVTPQFEGLVLRLPDTQG